MMTSCGFPAIIVTSCQVLPTLPSDDVTFNVKLYLSLIVNSLAGIDRVLSSLEEFV